MNQVLKRLLLILASAFLLVYVGFHIYNGFAVTSVTETVQQAVAYQTVDTMGIVFRDETLIDTGAQGYFFYTIQDGNRVAKNGTIANVYTSMQDALAQQQLDSLDEEIKTLTSINEQGTTNRANLSSINQQINETWLSISRAVQSKTFGDIAEQQTKLLALLNKKQLTIGKEQNFNTRLSQLKSKRASLEASFTKATETVKSPAAGYFISNIDGFENLLTTDKVADITVEQLHNYLSADPVDNGKSIGKVVGDYEWYMACLVPIGDTVFIKKGLTIDVRLPFVMKDTVPAKVVAVNKGANDMAAVVLQCTHMSGTLSAIRKEQVELRVTSYEGLRIPDAAIHFNDAQEAGVFIQNGNYLSFRKIRVLYHDEEGHFSICEINDDKAFVQLYDKIVTEGEDLYDGKLVA